MGLRVAQPPGTFSQVGHTPTPPHALSNSYSKWRHSQHIFMMMSKISHSWGGEDTCMMGRLAIHPARAARALGEAGPLGHLPGDLSQAGVGRGSHFQGVPCSDLGPCFQGTGT